MEILIIKMFKFIGLSGDLTSNEAYAVFGAAMLTILLLIALFQLLGILRLEKQIKSGLFDPAKHITIEKVSPEKSLVEESLLVKKEEDGEAKSQKENKAIPSAITWGQRLKSGLMRSRSEVWSKLGQVFGGNVLDEEILEQLEEILYGSDIGPETVHELLEALKKQQSHNEMNLVEFKKFLFNFLYEKMANIQKLAETGVCHFDESKKGQTKVVMIVGVNGAGKTTTIGKLATRLTRQGAKVVVGACDTFRAAAVDQLQVWCDRAGAEMVRAKDGANPSGVAYDAVERALNQQADFCILDTAGRLHTKGNLMEELAKTQRVLKKLDPSAPHQTLLVLDAITGQNAIRQAEEFHRFLNLTGLIFTKCDGSSKAGSAISIVKKLNVPISYIGVGETVEDLNVFHVDDYLNALLDLDEINRVSIAQ